MIRFIALFFCCLIAGCEMPDGANTDRNVENANPVGEGPFNPGENLEDPVPDPANDASAENQNSKKPLTPEELVQASMKTFHDGILSENETQRLNALNDILPTKADFEQLFGAADGERVWQMIQPALNKMRQNTGAIGEEFKRGGPLLEISAIDSRTEKADFGVIPDHIPIFHIVTRYKSRTSGSSSYLVIGKRVVFIRGLEQIVRFLKTEGAKDD